jgi:hypothetical protein
MGITLGTPQQGARAMRPDQVALEDLWAEPDNEVAQLRATISAMEREHRAWESELQSYVADLEGRAGEYEMRIDELISANAELHGEQEATNLCSRVSRADPRDDFL